MSGLAYVLCAPSGTGKTTVARNLVERYDDLVFSVSATTRKPRPGERDDIDYRFVSRERFRAMIEQSALLEWAEVHGELYGTPREDFERAVRDGRDLVLDIDVQGAFQIREALTEGLLIFLLPPSTEVLLERLRARGSETPEQLARRMETARAELDAIEEFDYIVVNERVEETVETVRSIIIAERQVSLRRLSEIEELRRRLLAGLDEAAP